MAKVKVLYFAGARDVTQVENEEVTLTNNTLDELTQKLVLKYGQPLQAIIDQAMYAVNMEYVDKQDETNEELKDADEIAIIPPVSGG
ncbi:ThiamineS/Molybdopterin converting factor subunit 1 [Syncephalastrum racemosum]|uniref:ThiamineS/Molybdopterin converting factor subunit 1 n=1 Tax=Syncephalastrum racemosum TaxID=13706 RepID=A0A1X2HTH5_SYNRA|nr:ThiamineS/Molybdopterin converting factor subunit 1 [Syncephalastrum racemosum]